ncbi:uncharacterized protein ARMOST_08738 [Armillaria ostoyae]|uniref:Uncharacterized protein n=1 Tax=Armillaria ostoyae TaxID=47428 RepID=A0A284R9F9_ARMOS|nr:uncharacterized protein ARMOST_08738 [Armillaria ostoyae]
MLYNTNLPGFISEDLWDIKQAPDGLVNGIRVHSLYSGAGMACCPWHNALAGDRGMKPLLYIFPRSLSPDSQQWGCRPPLSLQIHDLCAYSPISYRMIYGPDSNSNRAASGLSPSTQSWALSIHPTYSCALLRDGKLSSPTYGNSISTLPTLPYFSFWPALFWMITFPSDAEVVTASTSAAGSFVHSPYPYRTEDTILDLEEHYAPSPTSPVFVSCVH